MAKQLRGKEMLYTDRLYIESKLILCGKIKVNKEILMLKTYLDKRFGVELINADIYQQPVFKHMAPSLRLLLDKEKDFESLPKRSEERIEKIGVPFSEIIARSECDLYKRLTDVELSVDYFDYNYYRFQECYQIVATYLRQVLVDIENIYRMNNTLFLMYPSEEVANRHISSGIIDKVISMSKQLVECNGYSGPYLSEIKISVVDKPAVDRMGGLRNF